MGKKLIKWLQGFGDLFDWLLRIGAVVAMVSPIIVSLRKWVELDTTDLWILGLGIFGIILIILSFILRWQKNNSVKVIPDLLTKMDEKMKRLIGTAVPSPEKAKQFYTDAAELWNIDTHRIETAFISKNMTDIKAMVKEFEHKPSPFPQSPSQPFTILSSFLQNIRGLMYTDEVGTDSIKDPEYLKMETKLTSLQKRLRDSRSIRNLDRYLQWWHGSNHYLLLKHYSGNIEMYYMIIPAKAKACLPQFDYLLQIALNEYLGYVKDSVYNKDTSKEEWKPIT
jgi:hypothetical protein